MPFDLFLSSIVGVALQAPLAATTFLLALSNLVLAVVIASKCGVNLNTFFFRPGGAGPGAGVAAVAPPVWRHAGGADTDTDDDDDDSDTDRECKHDRLSRRGSNGHRWRVTCRDCGEVLLSVPY
jgi:hypothetical protein